MAKGKLCPQCKKNQMAVWDVKEYPAGIDVIYYCRPCDFKLRQFEDKPQGKG
ncbi:hypothetical protein [Chryseobacterium sp. SL1]|uniref:hypothetical protein n=1 Tax=Chryseobacterium sp. SL1 TaxID=2995159 RepID=UPI0022750207|nr:hypothetical protein [Chryseobacterium sp. SL1]MCY1660935.1 hypothetical protein [Chryseobacterium sp. SL1]